MRDEHGQNPAPRQGGWAPLVLMLVGLVTLAFGLWVAVDTKRRQRATRGAGRAWSRMERLAMRSTRPLRRGSEGLEERARALVRELWDAVDDWVQTGAGCKIPPVVNQLYAHGAFMGAAPALLDDPRWRRILAFLMPDVYVDVQQAVANGAGAGALMPMFENNPVMAAFGVLRQTESRRKDGLGWGPHGVQAMEWDVFLSSDGVEAWDMADAGGREQRIRGLVDTMVIAHASTTDTVQESIGFCQWEDVRRTRKAQLGGVQPGAWLDLYGRALQLGSSVDLNAEIRAMVALPRHDADEPCVQHTFVDELPPAEVIARHCAATGFPRLSVVLEIKSQRSNPALVVALVRELNRRGLHVAAVGSFSLDEIRGAAQTPQTLDGQTLPGPREILFMHFAGDVQYAAERKKLAPGTSAMFNGASLLVARRDGKGYKYAVDEAIILGLELYRERLDLHLGLYVQENDCDAAAAALLSEVVRRHPKTFELGFAWGGAHDEVNLDLGVGDHRGFGSQRSLQRFRVSSAWKHRPLTAG